MDQISIQIIDTPQPTVSRRKRRLVVDTIKVIPNAEFKQQLQNTSDIVGKVDLAPATKKAMHYLAYGGVGKFFAQPGRNIPSTRLAKLFFSHLTMTTEVKTGPDDARLLPPLDPELKTPDYPTESISIQTGMYHLFGDPLAKKSANSFDYLIKGMHIRPNVMKSKESRKRPVEHVPIIHQQQHHHHHHHQIMTTTTANSTRSHGVTTNEGVPVYEIVNLKAEPNIHYSDSSVVHLPVEHLPDETMLVGLECNFDSTNNKHVNEHHGVEGHIHTEDESHLQGLKHESGGNLVYTIQSDQSVVIKSEANGMDDNVLYFITL